LTASINRQGFSHTRQLKFIVVPAKALAWHNYQRLWLWVPAFAGTTILAAQSYKINRLKSAFLARSPTCFCT
jgi:hypothetical protein